MFCSKHKEDQAFILDRPEGSIVFVIDKQEGSRGAKFTVKIDDPLGSKIRTVSRSVASQEVEFNKRRRGKHGT